MRASSVRNEQRAPADGRPRHGVRCCFPTAAASQEQLAGTATSILLRLQRCACQGPGQDQPSGTLNPAHIAALQRSAGNRAVAGVLAGLAAPAARDRAQAEEVPTIQRLTGQFLDPTPGEGEVLQATVAGSALVSPAFEIHASLTPDVGETCTPGQYRQYVKGEFRRNGVAQEHELDGGPMKADQYTEDIIARKRYGYRGNPYGATSAYYSDAGFSQVSTKDGCYYKNWDQPSTGNSDDDEMELHFLGRLVNLDTRTVMADRRWSVYGIKPGLKGQEEEEAQPHQQHQGGNDHAKSKKMCPGCTLI